MELVDELEMLILTVRLVIVESTWGMKMLLKLYCYDLLGFVKAGLMRNVSSLKNF